MTVETAPTTYRLTSGETMTVTVHEPPLGLWADRIEHWWRDVRAPLVAGELAATSLDRFVVGEIDGAYVGSMCYDTPRSTRDVAVLEMVWTHPAHRRKGIARTLLQHTIADFRALGGVAMYLCTTNPSAFTLYANEGFCPLLGDGMRYLAPGHEGFDQSYFADAGPARVRPTVWGDLARVSALYNQPTPDWLVKDYPRRVFRDVRYESHFLRVWKPSREGRGTALVLENPAWRVVGIGSAIEVDSFIEQHVQVVDFWACPAYVGQLPDLLAALVQTAREGSAEILEAHVAAVDTTKQQLLEAVGFREEGRRRGRLRAGEERVDLGIYSLDFGRRLPPTHPPGEYYGGQWHIE
jgi:GNAT superfamily N-acetyltransferase